MSKPEPLEQWVVEYQAAGQAWVAAKLAADQLDEGQNNLLAALMNNLERASSEKLSEEKLKRLARGTEDFVTYTRRMCEARAEMLSKRVRYDALD